MPQPDNKSNNQLKSITWNGQEVDLIKKLGSGLTADVYQAIVNEKDVAIKVLRPGSSQEVRKFFVGEMNNITEVRNAWSTRFPGVPQVVPEIYGGSKEGERPFIIMDLVKGRPVDDEIKESGHPLSESVALHLFSQFGMLLVVLHEKIKKYYADIKIDNLWRLTKADPAGNPLLLVTDWNVLNDYSEDGKVRDLFFTSLYLFQVLTGTTLPYKHGQITVKLETISEFVNLSFGTREFLRKALNINVNRRFASAQQWVDALDEIKVNWEKEAIELNKIAAKYLDIAQEKQSVKNIAEAADAYQKARMLLDISGLKGRGVAVVFVELSKKVDQGFESTSHREKGLISLRGGVYKEAAEIFDEGADFSVLDPELLRRYYWLSRAADEIGRQVFGAVVENGITAVEKLVKGESIQAQNILEELAEKVSPARSECLGHLINEAKIINLADDANRLREAGDFAGVVAAYQNAYNLFRTLPATPSTNWAEKLGDIKFLLQEAVNDEKTLGIARECTQKAVDAYAQNEVDRAADEFTKAFAASPDDEVSLNQLKKCISGSLSDGRWLDASLMVEKVIGLGDLKDKIKDFLEITTRLQRISSAFKRMQYDEGLQEITAYQTAYSGNEIAMGLSLKNVLQVALETSQANEEVEAATKIIQIASQINVAWGNEFKETHKSFKSELSERIEDVVPQLLLNVYDLHNQNTVESSNKAIEVLTRLKAILPDSDSRKADILNIEKVVDNRRAFLKDTSIDAARVTDEAIQVIKQNIRKIEDLIDEKFKKAAVLSLASEDEREARKLLMDEVGSQALEGLKAAATWARMESQSSEPISKLNLFYAAINKTGIQGWTKIAELAKNATTQFNQYRSAFTSEYQAGNLDAAQQILDAQEALTGESNDLINDKQLIDSTRKMLTWAAALAQTDDGNTIPSRFAGVATRAERELMIAGEFLAQPIHSCYWAQTKANDYFDRQSMDYLREFSRGVQNHTLDYAPVEKALRCNQIEREIRKQMGGGKDGLLDGAETSLMSLMPSIEKLYSCKEARHEIKCMLGVKKALSQINLKKRFALAEFYATDQTYQTRMEQQRRNKKAFTVVGLIVGGLVLLGLATWAILKFVVGPKLVPTPTEMPVATLAPLPTNTPTPEPTPEPTAQISRFLSSAEIAGLVPDQFGEVFLIDDTDAVIEGGTEGAWKESNETGFGQAFKYIDTLSDTETLGITWPMDVGVTNTGLYQIAVNETKVHSMTKSGLTMQVFADDVEIKPYIGNGTLEFGSSPDQRTDLWHVIGEYQLTAGQVVKVKLNLTGINLLPDVNELGIDAVYIAEKRLPVTDDYGFLDMLPTGLVPVAISDYSKATKSNEEDPWEPVVAMEGMSGDGYQISLKDLAAEPSIEVPFSAPMLGPGRYHVYTLTSDKTSTDIVYTVFVDGEAVDDLEVLASAGQNGTFLEVATIDLTEGLHTVTVQVKPKTFDATQDVILGTNVMFLCFDSNIALNN